MKMCAEEVLCCRTQERLSVIALDFAAGGLRVNYGPRRNFYSEFDFGRIGEECTS